MAPIEIADDFTLGDLCRIIDHFEDIDIKTFSALLRCPLEPFLEECLRPRDTSAELKSDLHSIRLSWECEYGARTETGSPPVSSLELSVDGIGHLGRVSTRRTVLLYALRHLPLRIDPVMTVRPSPTQEASVTPLWTFLHLT
jgi:hypothetical protein